MSSRYYFLFIICVSLVHAQEKLFIGFHPYKTSINLYVVDEKREKHWFHVAYCTGTSRDPYCLEELRFKKDINEKESKTLRARVLEYKDKTLYEAIFKDLKKSVEEEAESDASYYARQSGWEITPEDSNGIYQKCQNLYNAVPRVFAKNSWRTVLDSSLLMKNSQKGEGIEALFLYSPGATVGQFKKLVLASLPGESKNYDIKINKHKFFNSTEKVTLQDEEILEDVDNSDASYALHIEKKVPQQLVKSEPIKVDTEQVKKDPNPPQLSSLYTTVASWFKKLKNRLSFK